MKFLIFLVSIFFLLAFLEFLKNKKARKEEKEIEAAAQELSARIKTNSKKREVADIAYQVKDIAEKVTSLKTAGARIKNCEKAIELLNQAARYDECREVITNFDLLLSRFIKIKDVIPVIDHVEKSYKHRFKRKFKAEQNSLLDALFEIQTKSITNQDILEAEIYPESTGEIVTIEAINNRLKELGWEENANV